MHLQPPPESAAPEEEAPPAPGVKPNTGTEADRLRERYKAIGEAQGHKFGEGLPGSKPPDFNLKPEDAAAKAAKPAPLPTVPSAQPKPTPPDRQP
jgi:hypothetical protein